MGTNYYLLQNLCSHCKRTDPEIHVGKKSWGWQFSFSSFEDIKSWQQWKEKLLSLKEDEKFMDEYDREVDVLQFIKMVEDSIKDTKNLNHLDYCLSEYRHRSGILKEIDEKISWKDEEGYYFTTREFS